MQWIVQFIVRHRAVSSLFLTVVVSLWMLSSPNGRQQRISRALVLSVFYPFQFTVSLSSHVKNIFAENKQLRSQVAQLSTRLSLLEETAEENEHLKDLIGFTDSISYDLAPARIVEREPSMLFRSAAINAGRKQSVAPPMPVISSMGVVGKVVQSLPNLSLVQLLRDPSCRTGIMVKRTRVVGILITENSDDFYFHCRNHLDVQAGDTVVTSGLGGVFPPGLMVGGVTRIEKESDPLFKKVFVKPSVDFEHIEEVFVVRLAPQWWAFRGELDSLEFDQ